MCQFFSFVGDGHGNFKYANWADRQILIKANKSEEADSHTAILTRASVPANKQAAWSKYEYNPLTKEFNVDCGVDSHDHEAARNWVQAVDWATVVPALRIKPIVYPFVGKNRANVTESEIRLLKKWSSLWASLWASLGDSLRASLGDSLWALLGASLGDSLWASLGASLWDSLGASLWDSLGASLGASLRASLRDSLRDSLWAYISSFSDIEYKLDFSPAIKLWESGLVPSFDGKTWRLHGGKQAKVLYELTPRGKG